MIWANWTRFSRVLSANTKNVTGYNHVDAGTTYLLQHKLVEAALSVYAHHRGLPSLPAEKAKGKFVLVIRQCSKDQMKSSGSAPTRC